MLSSIAVTISVSPTHYINSILNGAFDWKKKIFKALEVEKPKEKVIFINVPFFLDKFPYHDCNLMCFRIESKLFCSSTIPNKIRNVQLKKENVKLISLSNFCNQKQR